MRTGTVPATSIDELCINTIRTLAMDAVEQAKSGHPGTPMGLAPLGYLLFTEVLEHNPANPSWPDRDRFVLSTGHASMLLYSLLHLTGYDLSLEDLKHFRRWGSKAPGHPEFGVTPGVEVTTGPLGQGFASAVGFALAEALLAARFNRPGHEIVDHRTMVVCGDGDMMEGISSEAASLAGNLGLGKLLAFYDDNHISIEGSTDLAFCEKVAHRFEDYGWHVQDLHEEISLDDIRVAIERAEAVADRPSLIVLRTHIGFGSPNKQDSAEAHGAPLGEDEVLLTKRNLGWPSEEPFFIPQEALTRFRRAQERGRELESKWNDGLDAYREAYPELAEELERVLAGELPEGWANALPRFEPPQSLATRQASGKILNALAPRLPELVGGAADLAPSTETYLEGQGDIVCGAIAGRNLHFGVREHAMGAIVNGMTLHGGLRPYGATFFVFSDYMRPAIRLAALMECPSIFVLTHDSFHLGEDGPTHQPIEHLASFRAMPNVLVLRPADANETAEAWRLAILERRRAALLVLTRQKLPVLEGTGAGARRGAYVVAETSGGPELVLVASGSEVSLALDAAKLLERVATRVVSMPSWELFAEQDEAYREEVLPGDVPTLAVEAASTFGWRSYADDAVGIDRFGASAPAVVLAERFGFTAEAVAERARALLARRKESR
jgi:transketolase